MAMICNAGLFSLIIKRNPQIIKNKFTISVVIFVLFSFFHDIQFLENGVNFATILNKHIIIKLVKSLAICVENKGAIILLKSFIVIKMNIQYNNIFILLL